jgi:hypothetical protein
MPLLELQGLADSIARRDFDALNRFSEKGFYRPYTSSGITGANGAVLERPSLAGLMRDLSAWKLPSAGFPLILDSFGIPPEWITGKVGLRIDYTGSAATTNTINFSYNLDPVESGTIPGQATLATLAAPGPGTAGAVVSADVVTLADVGGDALFVGWKIVRSNADAYGANDVWIVGVTPIWYPSRQ